MPKPVKIVNEDNRIRGKVAYKKGRRNEDKSVQWILNHPEKYCLDSPQRIEVAKDVFRGRFRNHIDLFSLFDIVTSPNPSLSLSYDSNGYPERNACQVYYIQVKTNKPPPLEDIEKIYDFKVPYYIRKEIHIWKDGEDKPQIMNCNDD